MCYRLTLRRPLDRALPEPAGFALRKQPADADAGDAELLSAEHGGCACSLVWDEAPQAGGSVADRKRKQGWSEAKIARAEASRARTRPRVNPRRAALGRWLPTAVDAAPGLAVLVSWLGDPEDEPSAPSEVLLSEFLRAPARYQGQWVRLVR